MPFREVVLLCDVEEMSYKDTADALDNTYWNRHVATVGGAPRDAAVAGGQEYGELHHEWRLAGETRCHVGLDIERTPRG